MSDTAFTLTAGKPYIDKDPNAHLDYTVRFTQWLDAMTDTLASHTIAEAVGVTVASSTIVGKTVVLWLDGGVIGEKASVTVRVTTVGGRTDDRTVNFKIKAK